VLRSGRRGCAATEDSGSFRRLGQVAKQSGGRGITRHEVALGLVVCAFCLIQQTADDYVLPPIWVLDLHLPVRPQRSTGYRRGPELVDPSDSLRTKEVDDDTPRPASWSRYAATHTALKVRRPKRRVYFRSSRTGDQYFAQQGGDRLVPPDLPSVYYRLRISVRVF
jgi:hypothetical protein